MLKGVAEGRGKKKKLSMSKVPKGQKKQRIATLFGLTTPCVYVTMNYHFS